MSNLEAFGREFAGELQDLIRQTLGTSRAVRSVGTKDRIVVRSGSVKPVPVTLMRAGRLAAKLQFTYEIEWDSSGHFAAVTKSDIAITSPATNRPVLRYEFLKDARSAPSAHWHVHGESTELGRILGSTRTPRAALSELHLPVGGSLFRPALEDVIEFLIQELRFDHVSSWRQAVRRSRETWREVQLASAVRDNPDHAADVLRGLGFEVIALPDVSTTLEIWTDSTVKSEHSTIGE